MKRNSKKELETMEPIIVEELIKAKGKDCIKQVANKLKVNQDLVRHIYNTRNIGQKKQQVFSNLESPKPFTNPINFPSSIAIDDSSILPTDELICKDDKPNENIIWEETQKVESTDTVKKHKGGRPGISDDIKLLIALDYESEKYSQRELAEKYQISLSSVNRIIKEIGGNNLGKRNKRSTAKRSSSSRSRSINNHQRRKEVKEMERQCALKSVIDDKKVESKEINAVEENQLEEKKSNLIISISEPIKTINSTSYKLESVKETATKAGLCADRHEMNVDTFIYGTLSENEMFNYPLLYNKAIQFIQEKVHNKVLHLYCTGIQCALASVIKACHDQKITLSLFHYNNSKSTYMRQDVWKYTDNFVDKVTAAFADIMRKGIVYTFGGKINPEEFYTISVNQVKEKSDGFSDQAYVICDNLENAFKLYIDYIKDINSNNCKVKKAIFITKCSIEKGRFIWGPNISKSFNFK